MPVYKDEARGTWYASFYYVDWNGTRKKKKKEGFKKQSEAKEFERVFIQKQGGGSNMIFGSLIELYIEDCKSRIRPTTLRIKKYIVDTKIVPHFKEVPINKITPAMIRKWQNLIINSESDFSQTYLKSVNNQMSAIFNFAVRYYGLPFNPVTRCGSMGKTNADTMEFWTKTEFDTFIAQYKDNIKYFTVFNVLFYTGVRSGEFLALCLDDFDFSNNTLNISKSYSRINKIDIIAEPKTEKSKRVITIPKFLCNIVQNYANNLYDYKSCERLFAFTKEALQKEIKRGSSVVGVKRIRVHDLRHSHASLLIDLDFPPLLISERLGHENVETTLKIYTHLYPNKHGAVADKLDDLQK